jgi:hypothetical protein
MDVMTAIGRRERNGPCHHRPPRNVLIDGQWVAIRSAFQHWLATKLNGQSIGRALSGRLRESRRTARLSQAYRGAPGLGGAALRQSPADHDIPSRGHSEGLRRRCVVPHRLRDGPGVGLGEVGRDFKKGIFKAHFRRIEHGPIADSC